MAFDGMTVHSLSLELNSSLSGMRISRIAQPGKDQIIFTIKLMRGQARLLLSASPSLPLIYITEDNKKSPDKAPNFCMLLRKYISNGKIISITQPGAERVIDILISHMDEMGDMNEYHLYTEIMGKYSNIILTDRDKCIIDAIRRVTPDMSSVRTVLPGGKYFIPKQEGRLDPFSVNKNDFLELLNASEPLARCLSGKLTGISTILAREICCRASADPDMPCDEVSKNKVFSCFDHIRKSILSNNISPVIIWNDANHAPVEYAPVRLSMYGKGYSVEEKSSVSSMLYSFYAMREIRDSVRQRSQDLKKTLSVLISRNEKKRLIQEKQLMGTEKMDMIKKYGELLLAYQASIPSGDHADVYDYYENKNINIPMDKTMSVIENSNRYFRRYAKLKRTREETTIYLKETEENLLHMKSIMASLDTAENSNDLDEIREEMAECGYIKKHSSSKKKKICKSMPLHYVTDGGYDIYIGKNNYQNDELTFHMAKGDDIWFHAKEMPGSHVILITKGEEIPDSEYETAACLAAYYSTGRQSKKTEVDYVKDRFVKKPNGAKPGYVIYHTNYSMTVPPMIPDNVRIKKD